MKRCVLDHQFPGFEIGSHINQWNLDDPQLEPVWQTAEQLDVCLFVHPWDMDALDGRHDKHWLKWLVGMPSETATAICSVLMGGVMDRHPNLRFCFAHGGGAYPQIAGRVAHGYQVRPDLCATQCAVSPPQLQRKLYCDSLVHDPAALSLLESTFGEDKIVLGTDYPFPLGELTPGELIQSTSLTQHKKQRFLWSNGMQMLKLEEHKFMQ